MPTIPDFPPVTPDDILNGQSLASATSLTVIGDLSTVPVVYGKQQTGGQVFAYDFDEATEIWTVGVFWCWGEIEAIDSLTLNGAAAVAGVTRTDYLGVITQGVDATLAAAITDYSDTLVVQTEGGFLAIAYSVFVYAHSDYDTFPDFLAEVSGRKVFDPREGAHVATRKWTTGGLVDSGKSYDASGEVTTGSGMCVSPDGRHVFILSAGTDSIHQYLCKTPGDLDTISIVGSLDVSTMDTAPKDIDCSPDGTKIWMVGSTGIDVTEITMSTRWLVSTGSAGTTFSLSSENTSPRSITVEKENGLKFYIAADTGADSIYEYNFGSQYTLSGSAFVASLSVSGFIANLRGICIGNSGSTIMAMDASGDDVTAIVMTTAYDITTGAASGTPHDLTSLGETNPLGLFVDSSGSVLYYIGSIEEVIRQISIDTAPTTWEFTETPALASRDWISNPFFGPGDAIDDTSFTATANLNDATVTTEVRRKIGLVINNKRTWDQWRLTLDTYASGWSFKRGSDWVLAADADGASVATLTEDDFVEDSVKLRGRGSDETPTHIQVLYTDTTETVWRERMVEVFLDGVLDGSVPRVTKQVRLPGITRYSQATREANERLAKFQRFLQLEGQLFDDHINLEQGDTCTVTHALGLSAVKMKVIAKPRQSQVGRPLVRMQLYSSTDYDDSEETTTFTDPGKYAGQLGNAGLTVKIGMKPNFGSFSGADNGEIYIHGFTQTGLAADINGLININGSETTITKGVINTSLASKKGYLAWDLDEATPFTTGDFALIFQNEAGSWFYDDNAGGSTSFDPTAAAFDNIWVIGTAETTSGGDEILKVAAWASASRPTQVPNLEAQGSTPSVSSGGIVEDENFQGSVLDGLSTYWVNI